jgi:23S rRNA-/tRNA-specific pseudouridylate synthase
MSPVHSAMVLGSWKDLLLFVQKPSGLLSHGSVDKRRTNLVQELQKAELISKQARLMNRLDRDTSGLIVFCIDGERNLEADEALKASRKLYSVVVESRFPETAYRHSYLKEKNRRIAEVRSGGKPSHTDFRLLRYDSGLNLSLVEAELKSGRRHQIRVHLAAMGFPVVGDELYNGRQAGRLMLHSHCLVLPDGTEIKAPLPHDFIQI